MFRPLLWPLIEGVDGSERELASVLQHATAEQLILLHRRLQMAVGLLEHAGVRRDIAEWIVTRGRQAFEAALDAADRVQEPDGAPPDFDRVMTRVYRERFGGDIPLQEPDPSTRTDLRPEPEWEDQLWKVIEIFNVGVPIEEALGGYTRSELVRLDLALRALVDRLQPELEEKIGSRAGMYWTEWAIGHGKDAIESYLRDPASAPEMPRGARIFADELNDEYVRRYGDNIPLLPIE